ncbi:protein-arginine deiminase family protein [Alteromonas sp. ASW11-130]|uniref:protein-arginine deiminase family protein n=1 Tax=Alteromonas sp. ASW11-130 TaxID=3015775 RepID=UPI00224243B7|nr:protein-arginine deiminase family protein [Alteromonas sp. ASW11-130]MCW8090315.1 protein-arginine deiminase family protein [Alteromonas sp. ASW11-130]
MCDSDKAIDLAKEQSEESITKVDKECLKATLRVKVVTPSGQIIETAQVEVSGQPNKPTEANGIAVFKLDAGTYDVQAQKPGFTPTPVKGSVTVKENEDVPLELKLTPIEVHIHIDANRDGVVDDEWTNNDKWEPGAKKFGAIVLCNNDDENNKTTEDNRNGVIDGGGDLADIAPIEIRKTPENEPLPPGWKLELEVDKKDYVRVFDKHAAGGVEVIGPTKSDPYLIPDFNKVSKLGIEAISYPIKNFDGLINIKLTVKDDSGIAVYTENAKMRVAPWMMFNHANITEKVYMVKTSDNNKIRREIKAAIGTVAFEEIDGSRYNGDRWIQDGMEPGFASMPKPVNKTEWPVPATLRTATDRTDGGKNGIDSYPKSELLKANYGFLQALPPSLAGTSLDSFGNLECSPPFTDQRNGREYKFGRIVYGKGKGSEIMNSKVIELLDEQKVQEPFSIDTSWLWVGHVDEVITFLPFTDGSFKVLIASPKKAMEIVGGLEDSIKLFKNIDLSGATRTKVDKKYELQTVKQIKEHKIFTNLQNTVQKKIDQIRSVLKTELNLNDNDFVHIPVLFEEVESGEYIAYTAGAVNMLVVTKETKEVMLCIPKPFGPVVGGDCVFEKEITKKLNLLGLQSDSNFKFIDDFTTYHMWEGEIHCGTNSQRKPPIDNWWNLSWI